MRRCRPLLGTYVEVTADSAEAIDAAFAAVARIHRLMSAHDPESEVGRINRFGHLEPVEVSDETRDVLMQCLHWWRVSGGRFDVVRAGAEAFERGRIPRFVGQAGPATAESSLLSLSGNVVRLAVPACLDFGGIAKGMSVDAALRLLDGRGAAPALVSAGGDLSVRGLPAGLRSWSVLVGENPAGQVVPLVRGALATSGVARRAWLQGGARRHHLIDPATGASAENDLREVTVAAESCKMAEVAAKASFVLGSHFGSDLLSRHRLAGRLTYRDGTQRTVGDWPSLLPDAA